MKAITTRLLRLEAQVVVKAETGWGRLAGLRAKLLQLAEPQGVPTVEQLKNELDGLGHTGLLRELIRCHLRQHGFVQRQDESLAETTARALGIGAIELRVSLEQGGFGGRLVDRFRRPE